MEQNETPDRDLESSQEEELPLNRCEQCDEKAWDGYICHACGAKDI